MKARTDKDGVATFVLPDKGLFEARYEDQKLTVIGNKGDEVLATLKDVRGRTMLRAKIKD